MRTWQATGILTVVLFSVSVEGQSIEKQMGLPEGHCSEGQGSLDGATFACQVWDHDDQKFSDSRQIEIYRDSRLVQTIETDAPIREWHFWDEGKQLSVQVGKRDDPGAYQLFDVISGKQIDKLASVSRISELPQWAKGPAELQDESVPEGLQYSQERTLWIAKVLRQIDAISPGMTRKELLKVFTTEGGLFSRERETYVLKECRYIKVDVVFSPTNSQEAEDRIATMSRPYLQFSVVD